MVYAKNPQSLSPWEGRGAGLGETKKDKMCQFKTRGREGEGVVPAVKRSSNDTTLQSLDLALMGALMTAAEQ